MKKLSYIFIALLLGIVFQSQAQMSGDYSIGATGTYTTFNAAIAALVAQNVDGPVIFNIESGTYNEQVLIPEITGVTEANTIAFQSASGDSTDVILTYAATDENFNYTLKLDGADYIRFKNITLEATGATYARIVEIGYKANSNTFSNNCLLGVLNKSELVYSNSSQDTSNVFNNNVFKHGIRGINMTTASFTLGPVISGNEFIDQTEKAIYLKWYKYPIISSNFIHSSYEFTGIQLESSKDKIEIVNNRILVPNGGVGIDLLFGQWINTNDTSIVYNNYIYLNSETEGDPHFGIWLNVNQLGVKVLFNTVHITGNNTSSSCFYKTNNISINLQNNNLVNKAKGYAISFDGLGIMGSDFNNIFSQGTHITTYATDLVDWQTNHLRDINSISVDPYFVSDSNYPILNPALNGAGTPFTEVLTDIEGETRDANFPDIGTDEFTPAPIPMQGTFIIGGTLPDYTTLNKAVEDLVINGVNGAVVFNIASDTYNEQVTIPEITGSSELNTITLQSATVDSTDVIITHAPNTTYKHTIQLNGADYITFKNLSITNTEEWGWPVELKSAATHNVFEGNKLFLASQPSIKDLYYSLIYARGSADSSNVFLGNYFENGSTGIYLECTGVSGTQIVNNKFSNMSDKGIYLRNHISPIVTGNIISISTTFDPPYGISLFYISSSDENKGLIANNMITVNTSASKARGIYIYSSSSLSILYNTVKVETVGGDVYSNAFYGDGNGFDIINNIFLLNQGGFAAYITDTTNCKIDYNLYPGSGGMYYSTGSTNDLTPFGFDLHSFNGDPVFNSDTDLHTTDPWISNRGTPLSEVTTDIDGQPRDPSNPDVGADEYVADVLFAGDYTIGATGDFATFTEAVDSITQVGVIDSVIFYVQSGTYNEQIAIGEIPFVTDTRTVTFKPEIPSDSTVILAFAATTSNNYLIKLDGTDYITLEGFTFKALDPTFSNILELTNEATNNTIANIIFMGIESNGLLISSFTSQDNNSTFSNNRFNNGKYGIYMTGTDDSNRESGLVINNNTFKDQLSSSIFIDYQSNIAVENNGIYHAKMIAEKWLGIVFKNSTSGLIANNVISHQSDQLSSGIVLSTSSHIQTYFNSILITGSSTDSRCFDQESGGGNNTLKNNILSNEAGGLVIYNTDVSSFTSDYNDFYETGNKFIYTDISISDIAIWQATYNKDQHSKVVNPRFVSVTELKTKVPVLNGSATPIAGILTDIEGNIRDATNPDLGAYEYSNSEFVLSPDTTICINTSMILDAGAGYDSYAWSTGESTQTIETNIFNKEDSLYTVIVMHNTTEYTDSQTVSYTGPTVALPDTTAFCAGQNIQLIAGNGNDDYLWSTGSTVSSIAVDAIGTYTVKVTDAQGCFERDSTQVLESNGPIINLGGTAEFCEGDTLEIDAGAGDNYTYLWSNDSTTQILEVTLGGNYEVNVSDDFGCTNSDNVSVTENALPVVDLGEDRTICEGNSVVIDAGSGYSGYLWNDQSINQTLAVFATGEFSAMVTNVFGCENSDTVLVTVFEPVEVLLSYTNNTLVTDDHTGAMYYWYYHGDLVSSSANGFSYTPIKAGDYWLEIENELGCRSTSNVLNITVLAIEISSIGVFNVHPNPTSGTVKIQFENKVTDADIFIFDTNGKLFYQRSGIDNTVIKEYDINLSGIPEGIYLLKVHIDGHVYNQKILLRKM